MGMDKLGMLYLQLRKLRAGGVKMKDIAQAVGMQQSVLSSLYSSVLPTYTALTDEGVDAVDALDKALKHVTSVSKRRLLTSVDDLYSRVCAVSQSLIGDCETSVSLFGDLEAAAGRYLTEAHVYAGLYTGYSFSLRKGYMDVEPYMITPVADGDKVQRVYCRTVAGGCIEGVVLFSPFEAGYMLFNERRDVPFALKTVCLRLPVMSFPHYIKGISLGHDYNCNPVARRIILVREGDGIALDEFTGLKAEAVDGSKLDGDLKAYYDYTCGKDDVVRSMIFTSPGKGVDDLLREKDMLDRM
jgi:hypothetical protein